MITELPPGTPFVVRERGGFKLWRVAASGDAYAGVHRHLVAGDVVHRCVWKSHERLESRATYTLKDGDAEWFDTGGQQVALDRTPGPTGFYRTGTNIFVNRFTRGPQWLREAR
jgi:hypothetical protein